MCEEEVKQLIDNLAWDKSQEAQQEAMNKLSKVDENSIFFLIQRHSKATWNNVVIVIKEIGYPKNKQAIPHLIWLLQDMNWPGADMAIEVLADMDINAVIPFIEDALTKAAIDEDYMWIGGIQRLISRMNLTANEFKKKATFDLLSLADW